MDNRMASVCCVLVFISYRTAPNPKEKVWYIFMAEAAVDQQFVFGTGTADTALSLRSGLLFIVPGRHHVSLNSCVVTT
jgi:hypothetical protein